MLLKVGCMIKQNFKGAVVVITGGSRGIGRGVAKAFAEEGADTLLVSQTDENLKIAAREIAIEAVIAPKIFAADLRTESGCIGVSDYVKTTFGRCDILVNSAGATRGGSFLTLTSGDWQDGFALKVFGCINLCRLLWPLLQQANGHVINIIGGAARTPDPGYLIGSSANAALHNFTKGLSMLGKRDGINVNAIHPGITETDRLVEILSRRANESGSTVDEVREAYLKREGLSRMGQPSDVAALALFLASESARHIQGTAIAVDGGRTTGVY